MISKYLFSLTCVSMFHPPTSNWCVVALLQRAAHGSLHVEWRVRAARVHKNKYETSVSAVDMGQYSHVTQSLKRQTLYRPFWAVSHQLCCPQVSDWAMDYSVSGGTDREGWQYAADFPAYVSSLMSLIYVLLWFYYSSVRYLNSCPPPPCLFRSYHGYKTMKDFVRRRRWARYCLKKEKKSNFFFQCLFKILLSCETPITHIHTLTTMADQQSHLKQCEMTWLESISPLKSSKQPVCVLCLVL